MEVIIMRCLRTLSIVLATALAAPAAMSQGRPTTDQARTVDPAAAVERLFVETPPQADWFTSDFNAAVPPAQLGTIVSGLVADFGALLAVRIDGRSGEAELERALVPVTVDLDSEGRIAGLLFGPPVPIQPDPAAIADQIEAVAVGETAVLALVDGVSVVARNADRPMAVGSAF